VDVDYCDAAACDGMMTMLVWKKDDLHVHGDNALPQLMVAEAGIPD